VFVILGLPFPRPKRDDANHDQNTRCQNDDDPSPAHDRTISITPQSRNPYSCQPLINTLLQQGAAATSPELNGFNRFPAAIGHSIRPMPPICPIPSLPFQRSLAAQFENRNSKIPLPSLQF
jgi:hypothetical protein